MVDNSLSVEFVEEKTDFIHNANIVGWELDPDEAVLARVSNSREDRVIKGSLCHFLSHSVIDYRFTLQICLLLDLEL